MGAGGQQLIRAFTEAEAYPGPSLIIAYAPCICLLYTSLYQDVCTAFMEARQTPVIVGGRYGLSSKEFTPSMARAVFDNLQETRPKNHFTVGITDDVTHSLSLIHI